MIEGRVVGNVVIKMGATKSLARYVQENSVNLSAMSRETGIPYMALYDSLANKKRNRDLRVDEFLRLCDRLDVDPMQFYAFEPNEEEV